jgi:hypothetical protein
MTRLYIHIRTISALELPGSSAAAPIAPSPSRRFPTRISWLFGCTCNASMRLDQIAFVPQSKPSLRDRQAPSRLGGLAKHRPIEKKCTLTRVSPTTCSYIRIPTISDLEQLGSNVAPPTALLPWRRFPTRISRRSGCTCNASMHLDQIAFVPPSKPSSRDRPDHSRSGGPVKIRRTEKCTLTRVSRFRSSPAQPDHSRSGGTTKIRPTEKKCTLTPVSQTRVSDPGF